MKYRKKPIEVESVTPSKLPKGLAISAGMFKAKIKKLSGISEELMNKEKTYEKVKE